MSLDVEYAIKKDIRNNPVVREVDVEHKRQLLRTVGLTLLVVAMLLFWAWQRFGMVDMLLSPKLVETRATRDLHMVAPTPATTLVLDPAAPPASPVVIK